MRSPLNVNQNRKVNLNTRKQIAKYKSKSRRGEKRLPSKPIFCLKTQSKLKETEKKEDCFILDYVPNDSLRKKISSSNNKNKEISIVAEKGQVACRDFPHSRHTCAKYPFSKTNHESYCRKCYCFVCDTVAPCRMWTGSSGHCHAINNGTWKLWRKDMQVRRKVMQVIPRTIKAMEEAVTALENRSSELLIRKAIKKFRQASRELHQTFDKFSEILK